MEKAKQKLIEEINKFRKTEYKIQKSKDYALSLVICSLLMLFPPVFSTVGIINKFTLIFMELVLLILYFILLFAFSKLDNEIKKEMEKLNG